MAHTHLRYSEEEYLDSTHSEIYKQWKLHCKFNGWEIKNDDETESNQDEIYKKVNIDELSFL